jgi:hypothetical protein
MTPMGPGLKKKKKKKPRAGNRRADVGLPKTMVHEDT